MPALKHLILQSDLMDAGGIQRGWVKNWLACAESVHVDGTDTMTLTLHSENEALVTLDTPSGETNADFGRVLRAVHSDGSFVERRIEAMTRDERDGDSRVTIVAHGLLAELGQRGKVYRTRAGGGRTYHFQAASQTAAQHLANYILPALWEAGATYWISGTIESGDEPVTVVYDMDSPLSALRKLANAHVGYLELTVDYSLPLRRYRINLLRQQGGHAPIMRLRGGPALVRMGLNRTLRETVNRIYGFGATDPEAGRATTAQNVWDIRQTRLDAAGTWHALADPAGGPGPIAFDGQYTGHPLGKHRLLSLNPAHAQWYIEESNAARQEVRATLIQSGSFPSTGYWRIAAPSDDLHYVERRPAPSGRTYPVMAGHVERPEVSGVINYIFNPFGRYDLAAQSNNLPSFWVSFGTPGAVKEINPIYVRTRANSVRVTFNTLGHWVRLPGVGNGLMNNGRISYFADVLVISGQVEVKTIVFLNGPQPLPDGTTSNTVLYPDKYAAMHGGDLPPSTYRSTTLNQWERLGIEGLHNCNRFPLLEARIQIVPLVVPTTVIIDAGQITNTATWRELVEGGGGTPLIQAANARLLEMADYAEEVNIQTLDLSVVDDQQFPFLDYVLGSGIMVDLPRIDVAVRTRVMGWDRDWLDPANLRLRVGSGGPDLLGVLASRLPSQPPPPPESGG